jgi:hypothetical protein
VERKGKDLAAVGDADKTGKSGVFADAHLAGQVFIEAGRDGNNPAANAAAVPRSTSITPPL